MTQVLSNHLKWQENFQYTMALSQMLTAIVHTNFTTVIILTDL